jgi:5-methylcytosine-specific restriction enzyme A
MARTVDEWIASNDNQAIPARVKVRVFDRAGGVCAVCTLKVKGKLLPAYDHIQAFINGGEHRESNLQLLCVPCHAVKTGADLAEKSRVYRKRLKDLGIRSAPKMRGQGFQKRPPQNTASRPIVRKSDYLDDGVNT